MIVLGVVAGLGAAAPAQAVTFADYGSTSSSANLAWTHTTTDAGTLATTGTGASAATVFSFLTPALASLNDLPALFTLSASSPDAATVVGSEIIQPDVSGTFSFIYTGPTTSAIATGADLLSGTFTGAAILGPDGGSTGSVQDAIVSGGTVTFTSDFATFSTTGDKALSLSLTSVVPGLDVGRDGGSLASFTGVSTGSFASDLSTGGTAGGVPEPGAWAMLLAGFGCIGLVARRQRRPVVLGEAANPGAFPAS
jgi:hypothetical protein